MTLKQAIKSGLPYRKKNERMWIIWGREKGQYNFSVDDVLSDSWETQEMEGSHHKRIELDDEVRVFCRYRLASHEVYGRVVRLSSSNSGVQVQLNDSFLYLLGEKKGQEFWVSENQCFKENEEIKRQVL